MSLRFSAMHTVKWQKMNIDSKNNIELFLVSYNGKSIIKTWRTNPKTLSEIRDRLSPRVFYRIVPFVSTHG